LLTAACGLVAWLTLTGPAPAQEKECREVIARAMKAVGGEERLAVLRGTHLKGKGAVSIMGLDLQFTVEMLSQQPDRQKTVLDLNVNGMDIQVTQVFRGDKGWTSVMGNVTEVDADTVKSYRDSLHEERVAGLVALKEKHYQLTLLGEAKVGDRQAVGVRVAREGYRDVKLYFDKQSHLLVKSETRTLDPGKQEVNQEKFYSDFKELIPGLKLATKQVINHDGKRFMEVTVTELRAVDQFDDKVFAKP
jgi:hypothetical protein